MISDKSFLEQLKEETKEDERIILIQSNPEKVCEQFAEEWARRRLDCIKNSILNDVKKGNFNLSGTSKVVESHYRCSSDFGIESHQWSDLKGNVFYDKFVEENNMRHIFKPELRYHHCTKSSTKIKTGPFSSYTRNVFVSYFEIYLKPLAWKALDKLISMAKEETIIITKMTYSGFKEREITFYDDSGEKPYHTIHSSGESTVTSAYHYSQYINIYYKIIF